MKQHLFVEGKDYYFIGSLCNKHFSIPKGFTLESQKKFIKGGGGYAQTLDKFIDTLDTASLENIGIIVDADFGNINKRFNEIKKAIVQKLDVNLTKYTLESEGVIIQEKGIPKIGIWIMPDNQKDGYLEYFIEQLIDNDDIILSEARNIVSNFLQKDYCRFTKFKEQKAIIHSWLAWQQSPGLPFGTALEVGYFNHSTEKLSPFLNWIKNTFEF